MVRLVLGGESFLGCDLIKPLFVCFSNDESQVIQAVTFLFPNVGGDP